MNNLNLEEEYGPFLDLVLQKLDSVDIEHFGVKGMKWGVRKERGSGPEVKTLGPSQVTVKTKRGETLTLTKVRPPAITRFIAKHSPKLREQVGNSASMTITDSKGKRVGEADVYKVSNDEINLVWLGIKSSERGKGYATATMEAAVEFGKQSGVRKLTLEVPGNSPDAEHIYSKLGFKHVGKYDNYDENDAWGGLLKMEYDVSKKVKHSEAEEFIAHFGVKGMKWGVRKRAGGLITKARGGPKLPDSEDASKAKVSKKKAKNNVGSLSNKELQELVTRMNLEQQYSRLAVGDRGAAQKFLADTLTNVGKQQLTRLANDAAADQVGTLLKNRK